jgi:Fic family protein
MRLPAKPPTFSELLQSSQSKLPAIFAALTHWANKDKYLHWNDLKRRPAPDGFTHGEWWLGLKLHRQTQLRSIPLLDKVSISFAFGQPDALNELLHYIDRGLGLALGLPDALTHPENRDRYVVNTLIEESITSSQLEGAVTTRQVASEMLRTGRKPRDVHERMVLNNYLTMQRIRDLRKQDLTPALVFELHRRVTDGTMDNPDASGRFRRSDENVRVEDHEGTVFHEPPAASELPARLEAMCAFANGTSPDYFVHPVIRAILLHFWLAYDHPFVDGNGRTARALFYWCMLRRDYPLFEFISISQILLRAPARYAEAFLHTETDDNDLTYFLLHQAGIVQQAVAALQDYLARKRSELGMASGALRGAAGLNHRQQALLLHALREPNTRYAITGHQRSHNVSHQTAANDFHDLVARGLLVMLPGGRPRVFLAPADLGDKLATLAAAPIPPVPAPEADPTLPLNFTLRTRHD